MSGSLPEGAAADLVSDLLERCAFPPEHEVRCGVSGGADSSALLILAVASGRAVEAIHVDHGIRPESAAEAERVRALADRFGARFTARSATVDPGANLEARARTARHAALGAGALMGHTADDQAETLLINLLRGTGPDGLAAMRAEHGHPLIGLRRAETRALCRAFDVDVVEDPSNEDPRFVRNRVRHELLPLLADISERDPVPLLTRTSGHLARLVDGLAELGTGLDPTDTRALQAAPRVVADAALRAWLVDGAGHPPSAAELARVWAVVEHRHRAAELRHGRRVERTAGRLRVVEVGIPPLG